MQASFSSPLARFRSGPQSRMQFPTTHSHLETRTLIFRGFQRVLRDSLRGITCDIQGGTSAVYTESAESMGGRQRGRGRSSTAACAQIADHLDKNRRNTAVVTEVVCTLGRLATRTILTNAMHQPDPCPQPPARPLGTTNTQFLPNLACNPPTPHSNLETRTLIFCNFRGYLRAYCEELRATCGEAPQRYLRD